MPPASVLFEVCIYYWYFKRPVLNATPIVGGFRLCRIA